MASTSETGPIEIEEVKIKHISGNLLTDSKRIRVDSTEKLKKEIGIPEPKGKQREKVPTVVNDVFFPLLSLSPTIKIQELYTLDYRQIPYPKNFQKQSSF